jgi:hypothetical protein
MGTWAEAPVLAPFSLGVRGQLEVGGYREGKEEESLKAHSGIKITSPVKS